MRKYTLALICLLSSSVFAAPAPEFKEFESKGMSDVLVENTSGKVVITSMDGAKATVIATKNQFSDNCKMTLIRSGNKLVIKLERTSNFVSLEECDVDFQVNVPKTVDLDLATGSGNLTVKGIHGDLAFKVGSGDISAEGIFKKIDGKSGSGKVGVKGLTGGGELKVGSGEINLTYAVSSLKGELDLKTGSSDATILFPKGTKVKTSYEAGMGELSNELGNNPAAVFKVSMEAGSGDLNIKTY